MSRKDDEYLYQPAIHSRWIRQLYHIAQETGLPMTVLVDTALGEYCMAYRREKSGLTAGEVKRLHGHEVLAKPEEARGPSCGIAGNHASGSLAHG